jgi:hypothetical protein
MARVTYIIYKRIGTVDVHHRATSGFARKGSECRLLDQAMVAARDKFRLKKADLIVKYDTGES